MPWFEDIEIGARTELGPYTFTEEEIIRFAKKYDPQYFHIDAEAAKRGPFGGLTASGWHTTATWMKMMIRSRTGCEDRPTRQGARRPLLGFLDVNGRAIASATRSPIRQR